MKFRICLFIALGFISGLLYSKILTKTSNQTILAEAGPRHWSLRTFFANSQKKAYRQLIVTKSAAPKR